MIKILKAYVSGGPKKWSSPSSKSEQPIMKSETLQSFETGLNDLVKISFKNSLLIGPNWL